MRVIVSQAVIEATAQSSDVWKLHQLLTYVCEGRHTIIPNPSSSMNSWIDSLGDETKKAYRHALELSLRSATTLAADCAAVHIDLVDQEVWGDPISVLRLDSALRLLQERLAILFENSENDWWFLYGLLRRSERERIKKFYDSGWLDILHGGGSNLTTILDSRKDVPHQAVRTFVVFDSDRRHPDEFNEDWAPQAPQSCQGFEIEKITKAHYRNKYWVLDRRFIESYMPRSVLEHSVDGNVPAGATEAFFRLSMHGRWYFHMKKGFAGDNKAENLGRCKDLYDEVSPSDRSVLDKGFGRKLAGQYVVARNAELDWDEEALLEAQRKTPALMRLL